MSGGLEKFAQSSLRRHRKGIYEQLLAGLLAKSNRTSDPLVKISAICEAAYLSKKKDKLDLGLVEAAQTIASSFLNTEVYREEPVKVAWSFPQTEENWKRFIQPWQALCIRYFPFNTDYGRRHYPVRKTCYNDIDEYNELLDKKEKRLEDAERKIEALNPYDRFFEKTGALTRNSFYALKAEFSQWALPRLLEVQAAIAEEVDPQVYQLVLGSTFDKEPADKTKEEAGVEDSVGPG